MPTPPEGSSLTLKITDLDGSPVNQGIVTYTPGTNEFPIRGGVVVLENLKPGVELNYEVIVDDYARQTGKFTPRAGENKPGRPVKLLPRRLQQSFDSDKDATLTDTAMMSMAQISIKADSLVYVESKSRVSGQVTATITPLDVTKLDGENLPAPLRGIGLAGEKQPFATLAMVEITLTQGGRTVQPDPKSGPITVEIVLDDVTASQPGVEPGEMFELWYKQKGKDDWEQEKIDMSTPALATVINSTLQPGKEAVTFDVNHLTWWSIGAPIVEAHCFEVTVVDMDGNPVPHMFVSANGVRSMGTFTVDQTFVDGDGTGCLETAQGGTVALVVGATDDPVAELQRTGMGQAASCETNRAGCISVELQLTRPIVCTPGDYLPCEYTGPAGTENVGLCRAGREYCNATGTARAACAGEVVPAVQVCTTSDDETCGMSAMDTACADLKMITDRALRDCVIEAGADPDPTALVCNHYGVGNITGVEQFTSLVTLDVASNNISDLSPLSGLTSLVTLDVASNNISDLSPLSGLTSLVSLGISFNAVSNLTPLSGLTSLETMNALNNNISNLAPLSSLPVLRNLSLGGNNIVNVTPLAGISSLRFLHMEFSDVSDVNPLASLTGLRRLTLRDSQSVTTGVATLVSLVNIQLPQTLDLRGNPTIPCTDLSTLQAELPTGVVLPTTTQAGVDCTP